MAHTKCTEDWFCADCEDAVMAEAAPEKPELAERTPVKLTFEFPTKADMWACMDGLGEDGTYDEGTVGFLGIECAGYRRASVWGEDTASMKLAIELIAEYSGWLVQVTKLHDACDDCRAEHMRYCYCETD
jgi:hypothetical protein